MEEASGSDFRAANEGLSAFSSLRRRPQPSPVDQMREALDEPEADSAAELPMRRASDFVAAPALPLEEPPTTFVVKPSEGRAGRRAMDDLREQALRHVIASAQVGAAPPKRSQLGGGPFTPSRIILLSVALIAGGVAAFLAAQLAEPATPPVVPEVAAATLQVLVAKDSIGIGQRVTAAAVEWIDWPENAVRSEFVTSAATPDAITEMEGSVARAEILPGEPILEQKLAKPDGSYLAGVLDGGMRGVSVPVTAASASGGFIAPNDRVDVVSTRTLEMRKVSDTILHNVRVLAINGQLGKKAGAAEDVPSESPEIFSQETLATLELDAAQTELIVNAMAVGELTLVLRSISDMTESLPAEQRTANEAIRASSPFWQ